MILLEHVPTGERSFAESADGYSLPEWRVLATGVEPQPDKRWNPSTQAFEDIPRSLAERRAIALDGGPWRLLRSASPEDVLKFMHSNVHTIEDARAVLTALVLAVQQGAAQTKADG